MKAKELNPNNINIDLNIGNLLLGRGDFENSLKQYNYQSLLKNMFSSMFFSESLKKDRNRIIKRAINIPEIY